MNATTTAGTIPPASAAVESKYRVALEGQQRYQTSDSQVRYLIILGTLILLAALATVFFVASPYWELRHFGPVLSFGAPVFFFAWMLNRNYMKVTRLVRDPVTMAIATSDPDEWEAQIRIVKSFFEAHHLKDMFLSIFPWNRSEATSLRRWAEHVDNLIRLIHEYRAVLEDYNSFKDTPANRTQRGFQDTLAEKKQALDINYGKVSNQLHELANKFPSNEVAQRIYWWIPLVSVPIVIGWFTWLVVAIVTQPQ